MRSLISIVYHYFRAKYPKALQYSRVRGRKCYANPAGHQIHPLAGSIFEKSSTPLTVWFEAIYLFSVSKNGVSAKELQRHFGVTYKCAWRIGSQIRKLMEQGKNPLLGAVEIDETYYGIKCFPLRGARKKKKKTASSVKPKAVSS